MSCKLVGLPFELLKMIHGMVQDDHIKTDGFEYHHKENQHEKLRIHIDLIHWSSTCSFFRDLFAPDVFRVVKLINDEKSGSSLDAVSRSRHRSHVKELHSIGSTLGPAHGHKTAFSDTKGILPGSVVAVLSDLQRFSSLERLSINLNYDLVSSDRSTQDMADSKVNAEVIKDEEAWRALIFETYSALSQNEPHCFKHMEIRRHLTWEKVSTLRHVDFLSFLGQFEHFILSIYGRENSQVAYVKFHSCFSRANGNPGSIFSTITIQPKVLLSPSKLLKPDSWG